MLRYVALLIIPIVLTSIIFTRTIRTIESNTIDSNISMLSAAKDSFESRLSEVDQIMNQVAWDTKVISFTTLRDPFRGANTYRVVETREQLYNYSLLNNFIYDYYVIYLNSEIILGPSQTYHIDRFTPDHFNYAGVAPEQILNEITAPYPRPVLYPERQLQFRSQTQYVMPYIRDLSHTPLGRQAKIMFLLRTEEINNLLSGFDIAGGGWVYIADGNDILFNIEVPDDLDYTFFSQMIEQGALTGHTIETVQGEKLLLTYVLSDDSQFQYVAAQPYDQVMVNVANIRRFSYMLFASAILLGLLLAFFWSSRSSLRIGRTFELLNRYHDRPVQYKDPFEQVQQSVSSMIKDNQALTQTIEQQATFLRSSFFSQLIYADFASEEDLLTNARYIGLDFTSDAYAVLVVQILGYGHSLHGIDEDIMRELDIRRLKITETLKKNSLTHTYYHDLSRYRVMMIMQLGRSHLKDYRRIIAAYMQQSAEAIRQEHGIEVRMAWGDPCMKALDISHRVQQEIRTLDYAQVNQNVGQILYYPDILSRWTDVFYPKEWEYRLISYTREGNADKVSDILHDLIRRNTEERKLPASMIRLLYGQLYGSLLRAVQEASVKSPDLTLIEENASGKFIIEPPYVNVFKPLIDGFLSVCHIINERKEDQQSLLSRELRQYIEQNYSDKDLSLNKLSDVFNYSPAYLSQFVKENMGEHFSVLLEDIRMTKAKQLLRASSRSISEISEQAGYNSSNTFCRAFKRLYDISPGQYRRDRIISQPPEKR